MNLSPKVKATLVIGGWVAAAFVMILLIIIAPTLSLLMISAILVLSLLGAIIIFIRDLWLMLIEIYEKEKTSERHL
jgi:hypothetical protein